MAVGKTGTFRLTLLLLAPVIVAGVALFGRPAAAQYWGSPRYYQSPSRDYYQQSPSRDYFSFPFFGGNRPPPAADFTKAPPPRKLETPPTSTVVVIGDSMADWLGYGLDETFADQPDVGVQRDIRAPAGLIRYDAKNEALDWPQVVKDALANEKPSAIIIMLGINDRIAIRNGSTAQQQNGAAAKASDKTSEKTPEKPAEPAAKAAPSDDKTPAASDGEGAPAQNAAGTANAQQRPVPGGLYEFHTDQWAQLYTKRIDEMIAAAKSKGVPVLWVGLPALRGTKSTSDMAYLDELYRERAERAGIIYVDIWDGFVDDQGRYAAEGPDFQGQTRRLRPSDGVHFTKAGAVKLASYVDIDLRRAMSSHIAPVALPEQQQPTLAAKPGSGRPEIGPVLPLTTSSSDGGGNLLGGAGQPAPTTTDPLAAKVLTHGDPIASVAGRADDFSWPRPSAGATPDLPPQPVSLAPAEPVKKPAAKTESKTDSKSSESKSNESKSKTAAEPDAKNRRTPSARLDGGPRPPRDVGGGF